MSQTSVDGFMDVENESVVHGVASVIRLPLMVENSIFHLTRTMLHLIQMKGLFEGLALKDANCHMRNFAEILQPFNITKISQKSVRLRLFPFSLTGDATAWVKKLSQGSITSWNELIETLLDRFFPPSRMLQL